MITVTKEYDTEMNKSVRDKTDIQIKANTMWKDLDAAPACVWGRDGYPIENVTYKRSIDPMGAELPMMSLEWEETRTTVSNDYVANAKFGDVIRVSFIQKVGDTEETVTLPALIITDSPTINDSTISWKAVDLITATQGVQVSSLYNYFKVDSAGYTPPRTLPVLGYVAARAVDDIRASFFQYLNVAFMLSQSADNMAKKAAEGSVVCVFGYEIKSRLIMDDEGWNAIKNVISCWGGFLDFALDGSVVTKQSSLYGIPIDDFSDFVRAKIGDEQRKIDISTYKNLPEISTNPKISSYTITHREWVDAQQTDVAGLTPTETEEVIVYTSAELLSTNISYRESTGGVFLVRYDIGNPVRPSSHGTYSSVPTSTIITYPTPTGLVAVVVVHGVNSVDELPTNLSTSCFPLKEVTRKLLVYSTGSSTTNPNTDVAWEEDNPQNIFDTTEDGFLRYRTITSYYANKKNLNLEIMGDPSLECGDVVAVEGYTKYGTEIITENTLRVSFNGVITDIEINYTGYLSEKMTVHEWGTQVG